MNPSPVTEILICFPFTLGDNLIDLAADCRRSTRLRPGLGSNPRYFHGGFYVRSRIIYASRLPAPNRRGAWQASREQFLTSDVPSSDPRRFGFSDEFLGLSD
jgi:hypothetical protein